MEQTIHRNYANWADEKIAILDNKTPRQMIKTPKGLERVKKLLRSYETGERQQAKRQGRVKFLMNFYGNHWGSCASFPTRDSLIEAAYKIPAQPATTPTTMATMMETSGLLL